jgi:hypothetical protein
MQGCYDELISTVTSMFCELLSFVPSVSISYNFFVCIDSGLDLQTSHDLVHCAVKLCRADWVMMVLMYQTEKLKDWFDHACSGQG